MSSTLNKIKDKLTGDHHTSTTTGTTGTSHTSADNTGSGVYNTRSAHQNDETYEEAPVVKERVHDQTEHVDQTERTEVREKSKVNTMIQPIQDQVEKHTKHHTVDEGTSVHEHGRSGLDDNAEAELRRRREEVARQGGTEYDESHTSRDERPDVHVQERTNTVQQVQPVIEKDVYQPHRVEHNKKEVEIVHEPTEVGSTQVAPTVTVDEYKRQR